MRCGKCCAARADAFGKIGEQARDEPAEQDAATVGQCVEQVGQAVGGESLQPFDGEAEQHHGEGKLPALPGDELRPPEHQERVTGQVDDLVAVTAADVQCGRHQREDQGEDDAEPAGRPPPALDHVRLGVG